MTNKPYINPYEILDVSHEASEAEITKAFALAMKAKKYPADAIARARKSLSNPQERIIADYLRPILPLVSRFKRQDFSELDQPPPELTLLPEFDTFPSQLDLDRKLARRVFGESQGKASPMNNLSDFAGDI
ncbi:MAG: hypothetical protein N5P05_003539 [Chroococcopsis gigantea SAG 12.99]|jgi:hypothetical protein|nr:hypothetical protein [Chroococcopsis gigantea SAG 12.99]